jgi:hypothetical protein
MDQIWKEIENSDGLYLINVDGKIVNTKTSKEVKSYINSKGYLQAKIKINGKWASMKTHRLIAIAFIENKFNKPFINHIDSNRLNNHISNLEWVTNRENVCHSKLKLNGYSKMIGVSWHKTNKKWISQIRIKDKMKFLGYFLNEIDAYNARVKFETENLITNKYL